MSNIEENAKTIKDWLKHLGFEYEHPGYGKDVYKIPGTIINTTLNSPLMKTIIKLFIQTQLSYSGKVKLIIAHDLKENVGIQFTGTDKYYIINIETRILIKTESTTYRECFWDNKTDEHHGFKGIIEFIKLAGLEVSDVEYGQIWKTGEKDSPIPTLEIRGYGTRTIYRFNLNNGDLICGFYDDDHRLSSISNGYQTNDKLVKTHDLEKSIISDDKNTSDHNKNQNKKENTKMSKTSKLIETMKEAMTPLAVKDDAVAMTLTGELVINDKNNGKYRRYNKETNTVEDYGDMVFDSPMIKNSMYLMPVNTVSSGDIIYYKGSFVAVTSVGKNKNVTGVELCTSVVTTIVPEVNVIINKPVYKKLTSIIPKTMFGNMNNPFMFLLMNDNDDNENNMDKIMEMMMLQQMMNPGTSNNEMVSMFGANNNMTNGMNPLLMMTMLDSGSSDRKDKLLNLMVLQSMANQSSNPDDTK